MTAPSAQPTSYRHDRSSPSSARPFLPLIFGVAGLGVAGLQLLSPSLGLIAAAPLLALYGGVRAAGVWRPPPGFYLLTDTALLAWLLQLSGGALSPFANLGYLWFFGALLSLRADQSRLLVPLAALPLAAIAAGGWGQAGWAAALGAHTFGLGLAVGLGRAFLAERSRLRSDPLTCAVGRRYGSEQLAARIAAEVPFSLAFLDLRDFKGINDRYGHAVGDEVLCQVATRLACAVSPGDLVMRYGGDEFVVASGAPELSARLQRALTSPLPTSAGPLALQVDIGEARWRAGETLAALLTRADAAMYGRKTAARSRSNGLVSEHPETP